MPQGLSYWLAAMAEDEKGGVTLPCRRGTKFKLTLQITGDYSAASFRGQVRNWPDSAESNDPLASFTIAVGSYSGGLTLVTVSLTAAETLALPAAADRVGYLLFPFDILMTPSAGDEDLLLAGALRIMGAVQQ